MEVTYRPARPEDLSGCLDLFHESLTDMRRRQNLPPPVMMADARRLLLFQYALDTGIFHVAVADGQLAAFASAIVRDRLWFLSGFWARPALREQHVGMTLLRGVWQAGVAAEADTFFVWASSDLPALAAYMKLGMLPGTQLLRFSGTPRLEQSLPSEYSTRELDRSFAMSMDAGVLGTPRGTDHDQFRSVGWPGRQLMHAGTPVGYYYLHDNLIGPAAWTESRHAAPLLTFACRESLAAVAPGAEAQVAFAVPGMNHAAVRFAFDSGLRLFEFEHLLMSKPFGQMERYLPSGPALF